MKNIDNLSEIYYNKFRKILDDDLSDDLEYYLLQYTKNILKENCVNEKHLYQFHKNKCNEYWVLLRDNLYFRDLIIKNKNNLKEFIKSKPYQKSPDEWKKCILAESDSNIFVEKNKDVSKAYKCPKCKGKETNVVQQQTRSGDESMTTFVTCCNCNYMFKY